VFEYFEHPFYRFPLQITANSAPVAAVPGNTVTQTLTASAASVVYFQPGKRVLYPDGTNAVIDAISGTTVTVRSWANKALPAVVNGDILQDMDYAGVDGSTRFMGLDRLPIIRRYNYVQKMGPRGIKFDRYEKQKLLNTQMIPYMKTLQLEEARQLNLTMHANIWQSQLGESNLNAPGERFKAMQGIDDAMATAGAPIQDTTLSALKDDFEFLGSATDWGGYGQMRYLIGSPRLLSQLSQQYKWERTRFTALDGQVKLDLEKISFAGMDFGILPMPTFNANGLFGNAKQNQLYCIFLDNISLVDFKGIPMFEMGLKTLSRSNASPGGYHDYEIEYYQANCSLKINNPASFFRLNVLGL